MNDSSSAILALLLDCFPFRINPIVENIDHFFVTCDFVDNIYECSVNRSPLNISWSYPLILSMHVALKKVNVSNEMFEHRVA